MRTTIDYTHNPAKHHAAVEDIKNWLGAKYDDIAQDMKRVTNPQRFRFYCMLAGIEGFPVLAWYDLFHGEGAFVKAMELLDA